MKVMLVIACFLFAKFVCIFPKYIELLTCQPPNIPKWGGYGPKKPSYYPGDFIHYHCDVDTHIAGNYLRICMDSGDWVGDTPVCDLPETFKTTEQTSTEEPEEDNEANLASDGNRESCSSTKRENGGRPTWTATLKKPSQVLRVMLFLPIGQVGYEILTERADGSVFSCGRSERTMDRYEWTNHNCLEPNNTNIVAIKIRSLNSDALHLCEVVTHVLTDPTCVDPHVTVESGHLLLTRKSAELVCDRGFRKSHNAKITCLRTGVWTKKLMYCEEQEVLEEEVFKEGPDRETERIRRP